LAECKKVTLMEVQSEPSVSHSVRAAGRPSSPQAAGYDDANQHLLDRLAFLDWQLRLLIDDGRSRRKQDLLGFAAISEQEVEELLNPGAPASAQSREQRDRLARRYQQHMNRRVTQGLRRGLRLPLVELQQCFALSNFEMDVVTACLAVELDRRYERIYGYLHDDMSRKQPSPGLLLDLSGEDPAERLALRAALHPQAALLRYRVVEMAEEPSLPWLGRSLRIDPRIVAFVLGDRAVDPRILYCLAPLPAGSDCLQVAGSQQVMLDTLLKQAGPASNGEAHEQVIVYLHGERNAGAETLVQAAAQELGLTILAVDAELLAAGHDIEGSLLLLFREALLSQARVFLMNVDALLDGPRGAEHQRLVLRWIAQLGGPVFISGEQPWHWPLPREPLQLRPLQLRAAGLAEQFRAWRALTSESITAADLHRLTSLHPLPLDAIGSACRLARGLAAVDGAAEAITVEHLQRACRAQARIEVNSLARRVEPRHGWHDLVLPAPQLDQLRTVCSQARHASSVYGAWCFERTMSLGMGLNVLFSGPPGTGKTMAAEVIASDLKVDLLKIDLSQIVSKYIGETEKNLRQLFAQAANANAILLFDEADALLGKRSAVKDAHDRYANTEVAYLLQKMEEYPGISILTTNLRQNIDEAFTRRMRFIIEFPFPEDEDRLRIWHAVWPREVPLASDVDLPRLAQLFRLSGGSIRNVALAAAFLAAEQGEPVAMRHLMRATKREQQKMGRLVNEEEYLLHA
jgi:hypothetical protein